MLVTTQEIIADARKNHYAIGCFLVYNLETALAIARAAQIKQAPIIMAISESTIEYAGLLAMAAIIKTIADTEASGAAISLHLDHGKSLESAKACIAAGFSSVQIDASKMNLADNIKTTREVVEFGHQNNVLVEGELGEIKGGHGETGVFAGEIPLAHPDEVKQFVEQTQVDLLAAAIGTVHGDYENERVHFDLLAQIMAITNVPLVLHGASGLPEADVVNAVKAGVGKVNFGTEIKRLFVDSLQQTLTTETKLAGVRELMTPTIVAITKLVGEKIDLLGATGRAKV
jgi:ketose-bisphosphate aldolase